MNQDKKVKREFFLTNIALRNKTSMFLLALIILGFGIVAYQKMPKELFPEMNMPYILVQTVYPGNSPINMEKLVTDPIEKEIDGIKGIKNILSTSMQDMSIITIEFDFNTDLSKALQDVKDAVDKAKSDLPTDLPHDPLVKDIDLSEFPFININLYGDFSLDELKKYADKLEDKFDEIPEVSKVSIRGVNDKEIQINVDPEAMQAVQVSFNDIENAIRQENIAMSGGDIKVNGLQLSLRIDEQFKSVEELKNLIVKHKNGNIVYLKDIANVKETYAEPNSITRLNGEPVISIQLVKKQGENLLDATDKVYKILDEVREKKIIPDNLKVAITNDQSDLIKKQLHNLENSMVVSIFFVVLVLFLFLGLRNALFVGLDIPLSMFLSIAILSLMGYKINMVVLFSLILALGMLVDNAIVVVENIYRMFTKNQLPINEAAKRGAGEVAVAVISSTLTTLAAFFPLLFWDSIMGKFMELLPIVLIIVLSSSLFVALVLMPVFSNSFLRREEKYAPAKKQLIIAGAVFLLALPFYLTGRYLLANLLATITILLILNVLFLQKLGIWFKDVFLTKVEIWYSKSIEWSMRGKNPYIVFLIATLLLVFTQILMEVRAPKKIFWSQSDPNYINIKFEVPIGHNIYYTDNFSRQIEKKVNEILAPHKDIVKSVLTNIGEGAKTKGKLGEAPKLTGPNHGLITVSFIDYEYRNGVSTSDIMKQISDSLTHNYPGVSFEISQDEKGPPMGADVSIEIFGEDYNTLISISDSMKALIKKAGVEGLEGLKVDLVTGKPELIVKIDREKARRFGLSTAQVAMSIRTALFGKEVSKYKIGDDEYPIELRFDKKYRNNIDNLMNQKIIFRNPRGRIMEVPISAIATVKYNTTYDGIKHKNLDRYITLSSSVEKGYNANKINDELKEVLKNFKLPVGYSYKFAGKQEDQQKTIDFMKYAMIVAISLIMLILVTQFNSIVKPLIIFVSIIFSTIGVFLGIALTRMDFVIVMSGIGIVSLAGIVVNNAIVLIDYIDLLKKRRRKELGLPENAFLPVPEATKCIIEAGKTRLRPVLLTAITTILGLLPMAIGLNINFKELYYHFDPHLYWGGDMAAIWSPLAWAVIFGLTISTFLTLIVVPAMYRIATNIEKVFRDKRGK
jgi:multidrug efflux pump